MNRRLLLPAVCCSIAFGALYFAQSGRTGPAGEAASAAPVSSVNFNQVGIPNSDAERLVRVLGDRYQERYRSLQNARHNVLSRARPAPLPALDLHYEMSPPPKQEGNLATATISIRQEMSIRVVPCVVDAAKQEVRLFHTGRWMSSDEWLETVARQSFEYDWQPKKPG